jgi:hypothetical protein
VKTVQLDKMKVMMPLGSIVIECCSYILGRSLFQKIVRAIAGIAEWPGMKGMTLLQASHFIDATRDNTWEAESAHSNFKDRLTSGTITELRLTPSEVKANIVMLA